MEQRGGAAGSDLRHNFVRSGLRRRQRQRSDSDDQSRVGDSSGRTSVLVYGDGRRIDDVDGDMGMLLRVYATANYGSAESSCDESRGMHLGPIGEWWNHRHIYDFGRERL
jgi:hypothetical protein